MKASLQLKMQQQLTMTPQLQQAIRLLQLSALDLQQEIQQALDSNPLLEQEEDQEQQTENHSNVGDNDIPTPPNADSQTIPGKEEQQDEEADADNQWHESIPVELSTDSAWEDTYQNVSSLGSINNTDSVDFDSFNDDAPALHAHLEWQLNLTPMEDMDRFIAACIIDDIDERGYLSQSPTELLEGINNNLQSIDNQIDMDELLAVLHRIQQFDPVGVGATDLRECLLIQLHQLPSDTPWREGAIAIVDNYLKILGNHDYNLLRRRSGYKETDLLHIINLITSLQPEPGATIATSNVAYVIPDVIVRKVNHTWRVELNPDTTPRIRVNQHYANLRKSTKAEDNQFIKNHLQEAKWFLKSLESRNDTLLKVAGRICDVQQGFLEHGEEAMKPLVLADIAEHLNMHESTISRVTTQKYIHTPRGIFELKYFFSSHVATTNGGECSSTAIRALIKKLIAAELPSKPLSDNKLTSLLADQGIQVARRTIAKYRENMHIRPSNERKRLT
jgi:RNA polymerase sigma-54 factor